MEVGQRVPSFALLVLAITFVIARPMDVGEQSLADASVAVAIALVCAAICGAALHRLARVGPRS